MAEDLELSDVAFDMKTSKELLMKRAFLILLSFLLVCGSLLAQKRKLDTTSFVVLGEGLAAGMGNFTLSQVVQEKSYPSQVARQMKTLLVQPIIQPPGIGNVPGFAPLPPRLPATLQTVVRTGGPSLFVQNLSVPGLHLQEAISRRPRLPLIYRNDSLQTSINMILGFPALVLQVDGQTMPLWSQLEYAQNLFPTLALVELGYYDVLEAAVAGDLSMLPDPATFRTNYAAVVSALRGRFAEVIVSTIPDPLSTAYFSTVQQTAALIRAPLFIILDLFDVKLEDYITIPGVNEISAQFLDQKVKPLPANAVLRKATADTISARVKALNAVITDIAQQKGAVVHDLYSLFNKVDTQGIAVGSRTLISGYLGGFYQLNGYYPGATGHALIANDLLDIINQTYGMFYPHVDVLAVAAIDPAYIASPVPQGPESTLDELLPGLTINGAPVSDETVSRLRNMSAQPPSNSQRTDKSLSKGASR